MNGYVCFYNQSRVEVQADTSFAARQKIAEQFKVPAKKQHMISVVLAERNGEQVTHDGASLA